MSDNDYDKTDRIQRCSALIAGPLKVASYKIRDPETDEWSELQFHMTYNNMVLAVMGKEAAKLFSKFVTDQIGEEDDDNDS